MTQSQAHDAREPQRPTVIPITTTVEVLPCMKVVASATSPRGEALVHDNGARRTITVRWQEASFQLDCINISAVGTPGGAADWVVSDLRIDGQSRFKQPGDIPGDMFSTNAIDSFVHFKNCAACGSIEIDIGYIGLNERGCAFTAHLEGTVVRDDYTGAPPDLSVLVETSAQHRY